MKGEYGENEARSATSSIGPNHQRTMRKETKQAQHSSVFSQIFLISFRLCYHHLRPSCSSSSPFQMITKVHFVCISVFLFFQLSASDDLSSLTVITVLAHHVLHVVDITSVTAGILPPFCSPDDHGKGVSQRGKARSMECVKERKAKKNFLAPFCSPDDHGTLRNGWLEGRRKLLPWRYWSSWDTQKEPLWFPTTSALPTSQPK